MGPIHAEHCARRFDLEEIAWVDVRYACACGKRGCKSLWNVYCLLPGKLLPEKQNFC